jgi:hypothetical protein
MKRQALIAAGLGIAAATSAPAIASALSASPAAVGRIQVFSTPPLSGTTGTVLITGAIGDYGKSVNINKAGRPDANGTYSKLELRKGTIVADATTLNKRIQTGEHVDQSSCALQASVSAPVRIVSGTGAYAGITGTIKVTFTLAALGTTKAGQCNPGKIAAAFATVEGSGAVSVK